MTPEAHEFLHSVLAKIDHTECRLCVRRREFLGVLQARKRERGEHNVMLALFPCPACYDGATEVSTGLVLGTICRLCDGTKVDPRIRRPGPTTKGATK